MREDRVVHAPASPLVLKEKGQKLIHEIGVSTIMSGFTAGAKTYGGKIKDARAGSTSTAETNNSSNIQTGSSDAGATDE